MAFTQFTRDMDIISKLSDTPNVDDGLTAAQLKEKFDEGGKALKDYINHVLLAEALERPDFTGLVKSSGRGFVPAEAMVDYQPPMGDSSVSRQMLAAEVTAAALGGAVPSEAFSVVLSAAEWNSESKTIFAAVERDDLAGKNLVVTAHPDCFAAWVTAGVHAAAQSAAGLTFACAELPEGDLTANVLIVG